MIKESYDAFQLSIAFIGNQMDHSFLQAPVFWCGLAQMTQIWNGRNFINRHANNFIIGPTLSGGQSYKLTPVRLPVRLFDDFWPFL